MKNKRSIEQYMSFEYMMGFLIYPLALAILPVSSIFGMDILTVFTPLFSISFAIIALLPLIWMARDLFGRYEKDYKLLLKKKKEAFLFYTIILSIVFLVKSWIYAYFGIVYLIVGIALLAVFLFFFVMLVIVPNKDKIWYFIKYISPIPVSVLIASIYHSLGLKGAPIGMVLMALMMVGIYVLAGYRFVKSYQLKTNDPNKLYTKIYFAFIPITLITLSVLMLHTYYVTQYYYFMFMLLSSMITYLLIVVLAFFTLKKDDVTYFRKNWSIYLFFIPGALFAIVFAYIPMLGILLAFKDYNIFLGDGPISAFFLSDWVGFEHFQKLFGEDDFLLALKNTLLISAYKIGFVFPLPIFLAILINEVKSKLFKSGVQTVMYLPHFVSWAIVGGIFYGLLATHGPVNTFLVNLRLMDDAARVVWYNRPDLFQGVLVVSYAWKEVGYSAIVYLAAIVGIDPALYEAAKVDGANKFQQIRNITLPGLAPTIIMLFVLRLGYILEAGFDQVIVMANENVRDVSEIIGTYVFRIGVQGSEFSFATAVGLFNSVVALLMILSGNFITKKFFNRGLW